MTDLITGEALAALLQVVMIDLVLAGDNAVVIGLAAAGLAPQQRKRAIIIGILAATALRIVFAGITTQLLQVLGLLLAGGILLLWVCWKMWRELRAASQDHAGGDEMPVDCAPQRNGTVAARLRRKTLGQATLQIVVADISMSLDNVLAVAGAAREHPFILAFGLVLSIALMGIAADLIGRLLQKRRWIAYIGLAIIVYVAFEMIYRGAHELKPVIGAAGAAAAGWIVYPRVSRVSQAGSRVLNDISASLDVLQKGPWFLVYQRRLVSSPRLSPSLSFPAVKEMSRDSDHKEKGEHFQCHQHPPPPIDGNQNRNEYRVFQGAKTRALSVEHHIFLSRK
jgi:YjbE family integral membrane protein